MISRHARRRRTDNIAGPNDPIEARARRLRPAGRQSQGVRAAILVALAVLLVASMSVLEPTTAPVLADESGPPNVLIIISDDQRDEDLSVMPKTMGWFESGGKHFTNAFVTTSLCCPSRASIMTGRYAHNHRVMGNGQIENLDQNSTVQKQLEDAGYTTALVGKYFEWDIQDPLPIFDRYSFHASNARVNGGYQDEFFNTNGVIEQIFEYTTTYETRKALEFMNEFEADDDQPWLMFVTPLAPHSPSTPEAQYAEAPVPPWVQTPAQTELDKTDKPAYVQSARGNVSRVSGARSKGLRALMSVDDMVDELMLELDTLGEANTLAFYLSDNGYLWNDHSLSEKRAPYEGSIRIPLFMRWPTYVAAGAVDARLAANIDLAPSIYEAIGITPDPAYPLDGRSLLQPSTRGRLFFEHQAGGKVPTWRGERTTDYKYVEYYENRRSSLPTYREYYDLTNDPWELTNLLGDVDTTNDPDYGPMSAQLNADLVCMGATCP